MLNKVKLWKTSKENSTLEDQIDHILQMPVPEHIAIIMDGNGRWAKKRTLPRMAGHYEGTKVVRKIVKMANRVGVKALTLYAFSTENWKRPKPEVEFLMKLPVEFLSSFLPELMELNIRVTAMGDVGNLPAHTRLAIDRAIEMTEGNDGLNLNFALNYGSRTEILEAVRNISTDVKNGIISETDIDERLFSNYLMSNSLADPDLLIRTSGELRLSNFMLWQMAYTELWFSDVLWPDFKETHLLEAISAYQNRSRRFGGIQSEE